VCCSFFASLVLCSPRRRDAPEGVSAATRAGAFASFFHICLFFVSPVLCCVQHKYEQDRRALQLVGRLKIFVTGGTMALEVGGAAPAAVEADRALAMEHSVAHANLLEASLESRVSQRVSGMGMPCRARWCLWPVAVAMFAASLPTTHCCLSITNC
jgi:hypothetical protein